MAFQPGEEKNSFKIMVSLKLDMGCQGEGRARKLLLPLRPSRLCDLREDSCIPWSSLDKADASSSHPQGAHGLPIPS